ncbi:hypothetical protein GF1_24320 [Desulfolithobacter dissulfuricans]|uniref:Uncharacterized protein n=1 Tax=Desulfolithobacter dissulfuricans TaxID=2795293 RepID=A0A915UAK4_9BACT|nr:hypothetical protein [Desulfolithobacter dissulfuricans]BCO10056.1 hypothetical protein GF1_24320 [Desulfolithobacter dissulfuricans]
MSGERSQIIEDEIFILRDSGEIPEIALHATLHYLTEDPDGPGLSLHPEEYHALLDAAAARFRDIVLRDLEPSNRDLSIYRGIARTIINFHRFKSFCQRTGHDWGSFPDLLRDRLVHFLENELEEVGRGERASSVNCTVETLEGFLVELEMDPALLPEGWEQLCLSPEHE